MANDTCVETFPKLINVAQGGLWTGLGGLGEVGMDLHRGTLHCPASPGRIRNVLRDDGEARRGRVLSWKKVDRDGGHFVFYKCTW